ncbi:MAG: hypothetical protein JOY99_11275 [Sphingomonadaceae bacterium]|nr:hypothetical protein [Sphingomonadaceae bacterium]
MRPGVSIRLRTVLGLVAVLLIGSSALAAPEAPGAAAKITPDPDVKPEKPIGAQARAKNGPDPMAVPPADAGMTDDPTDMPVHPRDSPPIPTK